MNKKNIIVSAVVIILVTGLSFWGGIVYGKSKVPMRALGQAGTFGGRNGALRTGGVGIGGFTVGEIISKDDKSVTLKLQNGGSKIIFLGTNTKITKPVSGVASDLAVGTEISVTGAANTDGSVNADSLQIRPVMSASVVQ